MKGAGAMIVLHPDGTAMIDDNRETAPTLEEVQKIVGGYVELVSSDVLFVTDRAQVYCNEDGKRLQLPLNHTATWLCAHLLAPDDWIVGNVVLLIGKARWTSSDADDEASEPHTVSEPALLAACRDCVREAGAIVRTTYFRCIVCGEPVCESHARAVRQGYQYVHQHCKEKKT